MRTELSRRNFVRYSMAASIAGVVLEHRTAFAAEGLSSRPERLKLGIASYSLRKFTLQQTIQMAQEAGVKYLTLKDVHLPLNSSGAELAAARQEIERAGLVLMGGGVINMTTEQQVRAGVKYAKEAGMPMAVCNPDPALLDTLEQEARAAQIRIAIHNHGPGDTRWPSPLTILERVSKRDPLMGICMDLGHTVRLKEEPIAVIKKCGKRLHDFHIKDVTAASAEGKAIEVGRGVIDIPGVLKALLQLKFSGHVALEHELNPDNPLPGMRESFGYMRGVLEVLS